MPKTSHTKKWQKLKRWKKKGLKRILRSTAEARIKVELLHKFDEFHVKAESDRAHDLQLLIQDGRVKYRGGRWWIDMEGPFFPSIPMPSSLLLELNKQQLA